MGNSPGEIKSSMQFGFVDVFEPEIAVRFALALVMGGLIGLERSYHGRSAGFRTHALVSLSTALLMLLSVYESRWVPIVTEARATFDPTRVAQGIMTGIGFLGAGAIVRDGLSVRGLTTAGSIWMTAAIGILVGIGFYAPAVMATVLTLGVLSSFRWIENKLPVVYYAQLTVRFAESAILSEADLRKLLREHGFSVTNFNYWNNREDGAFEYKTVLRARSADRARELTSTLTKLEAVREFRIMPTSD
jgi:putative Mg2+ transporter-C (MgtC) family protein